MQSETQKKSAEIVHPSAHFVEWEKMITFALISNKPKH